MFCPAASDSDAPQNQFGPDSSSQGSLFISMRRTISSLSYQEEEVGAPAQHVSVLHAGAPAEGGSMNHFSLTALGAKNQE